MERFLKDLNDEQKDAVKANGNVLITACPGSGKTRVLTHKLAYEINLSTRPKHVFVALTYTNRAADELKKRTCNFDIEDDKLWTGTIHSFCLEWILKPYIGFCREVNDGFTIIDEYETEKLINDLKPKYGIRAFDSIKKIYRLNGEFEVNELTHLPLIYEYKSILRDMQAIDFDDILYFAWKLIDKYSLIASRLANIFPFIAIDEYQDTQELQYAILAAIVKAGSNKTRVFFVGDISQAIYSSIGGVAKSGTEIKAQFKLRQLHELTLSGNYRSNQRVINYYANYQITDFTIAAKGKYANNKGFIHHDFSLHRDTIHEHISELIASYIGNGIPPHEICVVAPQWWMIIPMGRKLQTTLPHIDFDAFGLSPFRRVRENIWYKVLRLYLTTPGNSNYLLRYQWIRELVETLHHFMPDFLQGIENEKRFLLRLIREHQCDDEDSKKAIIGCMKHFTSSLKIQLNNYPELNNAQLSFMKGFQDELDNNNFQFARNINTLKRVFNNRKGVVISTCHGVKGEEYEVVIAFGLLHGYLPNWKEPDPLAAQKLLYVISSRAKNNLHLISEQGHMTRRGDPYQISGPLARLNYTYDKPS